MTTSPGIVRAWARRGNTCPAGSRRAGTRRAGFAVRAPRHAPQHDYGNKQHPCSKRFHDSISFGNRVSIQVRQRNQFAQQTTARPVTHRRELQERECIARTPSARSISLAGENQSCHRQSAMQCSEAEPNTAESSTHRSCRGAAPCSAGSKVSESADAVRSVEVPRSEGKGTGAAGTLRRQHRQAQATVPDCSVSPLAEQHRRDGRCSTAWQTFEPQHPWPASRGWPESQVQSSHIPGWATNADASSQQIAFGMPAAKTIRNLMKLEPNETCR